MSYDDFIADILNKRGRVIDAKNKERHHILPKCMGGTNDPDNLIDLTLEEHFIAHKLLAEENPSHRAICYAFNRMSHIRQTEELIQTPQEYRDAKLEAKRKLKKHIKIHGNAMQGRKMSVDARRKMSEAHKRRSPESYRYELSPERRAEAVAKFKKTYWSKPEEVRKAQYEKANENRTPTKYWQGKTLPQDMKDKISNTLKEKHLAPPHSIKTYCRETDTVYRSMTEAQEHTGVDRHIIKQYIEGKRKDDKFHFSLVCNNE